MFGSNIINKVLLTAVKFHSSDVFESIWTILSFVVEFMTLRNAIVFINVYFLQGESSGRTCQASELNSKKKTRRVCVLKQCIFILRLAYKIQFHSSETALEFFTNPARMCRYDKKYINPYTPYAPGSHSELRVGQERGSLT